MDDRNNKKKTIAFFAVMLFVTMITVAHAASVQLTTISPYIPGSLTVGSQGPGGWLVNFYNYAFMIGGILAFGGIVYGGIKYAVSGGNPSAEHEARAWIQSALLGLLLLAAAYLILYTINPALVNLSLDLPKISVPASNTPTIPTSTTNTTASTNTNQSPDTTSPSPCNPACAPGTETCTANGCVKTVEQCPVNVDGGATQCTYPLRCARGPNNGSNGFPNVCK